MKQNKLEIISEKECVVVFFPEMAEFNNDVLTYLEKSKIDSEVRDGGVIITQKSNIHLFEENGFKFFVVKDMKELYSRYKEQLADYANQVRRFYGLPEKN